MAMSAAVAAGGFPNWVMLEPVVFRRDDDRFFPDESKAPVRASGTTSWNAEFRVAFELAEPPLISRLYAQLPDFPGPRKERPLALLATHRHLALFRVGTESPGLFQDFFIYSAHNHNPSSLQRLPPCTEDLDWIFLHGNKPPPRRHPHATGKGKERRLQHVRSMGLLCHHQGEEEEFAVAELLVSRQNINFQTKVFADIYLFVKSAGRWVSQRLPIDCSDDDGDVRQLCLWETHVVTPVDRWLCWVDYDRGILLYDMSRATVSFVHFPLHKLPCTNTNRSRECSWLYRGLSAFDQDSMLKFVNVTRDDGIGYGALKPGAGFTITSHTLCPVLSSSSSGMEWNKDRTITSDELWSSDDRLPREVPMFPQVNIDRPHVVHFVISDFTYVMKKMWLVAIDMNTRTVESFYQYTNGREDKGTDYEFLTHERSMCPRPFLPCEFSKYLSSSRTSLPSVE